jgi:kynurenine formamidase
LAPQVFGAANVPGFKNVTNLSKLPANGFRIIALPVKIGQGSGAPLRIVAEIY